jgi:hypothetical protein
MDKLKIKEALEAVLPDLEKVEAESKESGFTGSKDIKKARLVRSALAALSAPTHAQEAVAWQARRKDDGEGPGLWFDVPKHDLSAYRRLDQYEVRPLYAAPQEPAQVSEEDILKHMSKYWQHQWHDGDEYVCRISREELAKGVTALLSQVSTQEQASSDKDAKRLDYLEKNIVIAAPGCSIRAAIDQAMAQQQGGGE